MAVGQCPVCPIAAPRPQNADGDQLEGHVSLHRCSIREDLGRLVFCDVDGVLNRQCGSPEPQCLAELQRLLVETGAKLILSSDWRRKDHLIRELRQALEKAGVDGSVIIGRTPALKDANRPQEITAWLEEHSSIAKGSWIAVDDMPLEEQDGPNGRLQGRCVQTDERIGLSSTSVDLAISLLNG